jgi:nucleoside-diphosphate-sugar epimerase
MEERGVTSARSAPGLLELRPAPAGLPETDLRPPVIPEPGDPFASLRVVDLIARIERGRPTRIADIVDRLNSIHLDWLFSVDVVIHVVLQLQANWMADYRNSSGIVLDEGPYGPTVEIEDSTRVDPWIVRQALRDAAKCRERLDAFTRLDRPTGEG